MQYFSGGLEMTKYYCDLCKKEITPADIHTSFDIKIGNKIETVEMHNLCWIKLKEAVKEMIKDIED